MIEKLEQIDEILASYEDWMHGKDGENCTKARKLLIEVTEKVKKCDSVCSNHDPEIRFPSGNGKCKSCGSYHEQTDV